MDGNHGGVNEEAEFQNLVTILKESVMIVKLVLFWSVIIFIPWLFDNLLRDGHITGRIAGHVVSLIAIVALLNLILYVIARAIRIGETGP